MTGSRRVSQANVIGKRHTKLECIAPSLLNQSTMKMILLTLASALVFACSAKTERQTAKTPDGLVYHPSPATTGDGLPAPPIDHSQSKEPEARAAP